MSIAERIRALEETGELRRYSPRSRHPPRRRMYLTKRAIGCIEKPNSYVNAMSLQGHVVAAMDRWTTGGRIHAHRRRPIFLKRLDPPPPDVWEIRVTDPTPQIRILGRFADLDTLIVSNMHSRGHLGERGSKAWTEALKLVVEDWETLFPDHGPLGGEKISDFVSENCDDFAI